jgi:hypothetical protein
VFGALLLVLFLALQSASPSSEYTRGRAAFEGGDYASAIEILRPLLYPEPRLQSEGEIAAAHRMLGVAHLFERQRDQAAQEFRRLLQLRPDYRMDSRLDPPLVVDFFNGILKEQEAELAELSRKRAEAEADEQRRLDARNGPITVERRFLRNSRTLAFLPFGAGQFQNGQRAKGWVFLGAQGFLGGVSLAAFATNFALHGLRPVLRCEAAADPGFRASGCSPGYRPTKDRSRSQLLLKVQLLSGALFFAAAIWGVTDAILNYQPEVEILPPDKRESARASLAPRLVFSSMGGSMGDDSWCGALAFRF